ncbi:hypothetical protein O5D80_004628 [Batrachochytrium dendrobatidis]|nr:hypothetical protein O5D80_004628 [Batrachochytrium dendrobatidis]
MQAILGMSNSKPPIKVLEFYSGIGGFHAALSKTHIAFQVLQAFDMNINANLVYQTTHPTVPVSVRNIGFLSPIDLDAFQADMFLLSPPCQPYSRKGSRKGINDSRADSFVQLLDSIKKMQQKPKWMLVENVYGFETSDTFTILKEKLVGEYDIQSFELNPWHFGIPYSRPRIFILAKLRVCNQCKQDYRLDTDSHQGDHEKCSECQDSVFKGFSIQEFNHKVIKQEQAHAAMADRFFQGRDTTPQTLAGFLDNPSSEDTNPYMLVMEQDLWAAARHFDVVGPESTRSCCFTKAYGSYARGGGSVVRTDSKPGYKEREEAAFKAYNELFEEHKLKVELLQVQKPTVEIDSNTIAAELRALAIDSKQEPIVPLNQRGKKKRVTKKKPSMEAAREGKSKWWDELSKTRPCPLVELKLRYFSSSEMGRLHGFPKEQLKFPESTTQIQRFKLIGNSLHVDIVRMLIEYMME